MLISQQTYCTKRTRHAIYVYIYIYIYIRICCNTSHAPYNLHFSAHKWKITVHLFKRAPAFAQAPPLSQLENKTHVDNSYKQFKVPTHIACEQNANESRKQDLKNRQQLMHSVSNFKRNYLQQNNCTICKTLKPYIYIYIYINI